MCWAVQHGKGFGLGSGSESSRVVQLLNIVVYHHCFINISVEWICRRK